MANIISTYWVDYVRMFAKKIVPFPHTNTTLRTHVLSQSIEKICETFVRDESKKVSLLMNLLDTEGAVKLANSDKEECLS